MRDNHLRQTILDRVPGSVAWRNLCVTASLAFALGFCAAMGVFAFSEDVLTDDDLAKLAELAACSTGQPASSLWLQAQSDSTWVLSDKVVVAKRFLVDIDIDRCSVRETANANVDERKIGAFPPGDRYN